LEQQADVALREEVLRGRAAAGREVADLLHLEAEGRGVEVRRLLRVAHEEPDVVHVDQSERVGARIDLDDGLLGGAGHGAILERAGPGNESPEPANADTFSGSMSTKKTLSLIVGGLIAIFVIALL
ncbi:MAG: hypothetical protein ACK55I_26225, partial [bacterium]